MYVDGVVVNVLNPKTALFFLAFVPQFVDPDRGPVWTQTLILGCIFIGLGMISDSAYAMGGAQIGSWLARRPTTRARSQVVEGGILIALGVTTLAIPQRRSRL
jgi:threonine/homoserine/homoserine lactone efflux protein